ncbi:MAG: hypothetical protein ACJ796_13600 [Gemmatimonadaceae bacterium]
MTPAGDAAAAVLPVVRSWPASGEALVLLVTASWSLPRPQPVAAAKASKRIFDVLFVRYVIACVGQQLSD